MMKTLTVFTPTYNRAHTLPRLYRSLVSQISKDFEWLVIDDGSTDETESLVSGWKAEGLLVISYVKKANGGLYTGYNVAYETIQTELCVCIDSDDAMPPEAVERIVEFWRKFGSDEYAGLLGLDFDMNTGDPIGGRFPSGQSECFFPELYAKNIHRGDSKPVLRTDLMREVAPQEGFPGEKNFNPVYMLLQVGDRYPLLMLDECLCLVEYQKDDSMSANIFRQYSDSPRSFAKMRLLEMTLKHSTLRNRYRCAVHYVAESLVSGQKGWLRRTPRKLLTALAVPPGIVLYFLIAWKNREVS